MDKYLVRVGNYGYEGPILTSEFEDETVGKDLVVTSGILVTRISGNTIYVRDWHVDAHFDGPDALMVFEQHRENMDFNYCFSEERILTDLTQLNGTDPVLRNRLERSLQVLH